MKLIRFMVENFRSIENSGWIACDDVTTLVGINESGKSNVLLALWKLNPASAGDIDILHDLPVSKLSTLRSETEKIKFVTAEFLVDEESEQALSEERDVCFQPETRVVVSRYYDGHYGIEYSIQPQLSVYIDQDENFDKESFRKQLGDAVIALMPKFVYYSNYGNLSTKIYLPHAIKWLNGETVAGIDANEEQVRTLRVLFDFVKLDPKEILELGKDPKDLAKSRTRNQGAVPTTEEIEKAENDKEKRSILLQSASGELTKKFKNWWKQGKYKFRFEADGDYFRIWVSDDKRPDEVSLELRSTGLQWFLSFYLIFLVESQEKHKDAILLLDEAGLTLHPLAQRDLAKFFDNLSQNNQIINTTHSPFIIDPTNIDRCRVVYIDDNGYTVVSSNLREGSESLNQKSIYAVHAALGLSVSDILLQGCQCVVVEGPTDQFYLNAIKTFLIKEGLIVPKQEIVFIPSGGVKGISGVVSIIGADKEKLPIVIIDSDKSGKGAIKSLTENLYKGQSERIIEVQSIADKENSEIEDLIPIDLMRRAIDRMFIMVENDDFADYYDSGKPLVPQIEAFSKKHSVNLSISWKIDLAKSFMVVLGNKTKKDIDNVCKDMWVKLFKKIEE